MNEFDQNITQQEREILTSLQREGLTVEEKAEIRMLLSKAITQKTSFLGMSWLLSSQSLISKPVFGGLVFLVLLSTGIGVGKASESALPGEILYATKTNLYEPVKGTFSSEDRAEQAKERIRNRLLEAEKLNLEGRLDPTKKALLETLIESEWKALEVYQEGVTRSGLAEELRDFSQQVLLKVDERGLFLIVVRSAPVYQENNTQSHSEQPEEDETSKGDEDSHSRADEKEEHQSYVSQNKRESQSYDDEDRKGGQGDDNQEREDDSKVDNSGKDEADNGDEEDEEDDQDNSGPSDSEDDDTEDEADDE